jgi:hypothetical protein
MRFLRTLSEDSEEVVAELLEKCLAPEVTLHIECRNYGQWTGFAEKDFHGSAEVIQFPAQLRNAFSDLSLCLEDVVNERREGVDSIALARVTCTGIQRYPFLPLLPVGTQIQFALHMETLEKVNGRALRLRWSFNPINPVLKMVKELSAHTGSTGKVTLALDDATRNQDPETKHGALPYVAPQHVLVPVMPLLVPVGFTGSFEEILPAPANTLHASHQQNVEQNSAALYQEAQRVHDMAAALRAQAAVQQQAQKAQLGPAAEAPAVYMNQLSQPGNSWSMQEQSSPRQDVEKQVAALKIAAQRAQLAAAALRAQIRLEEDENQIRQRLPNGTESEEEVSLMLRNIPLDMTRDMFTRMLDAEGFAGRYDFVYLPLDFKTSANLGYAFVNMLTHRDAQQLRQHFGGFCKWCVRSAKTCEATWSTAQGLAAYIDRYRNNPVMHDSIAEKAKPMLFEHGVRVPFPAPTRKLKAPRL